MPTSDPRARQLAEHMHELARRKATRLPEWKDLSVQDRQKATTEAKLWLQAAVESGIASPLQAPTDQSALTHSERRDRVAGSIYEYWNHDLAWTEADPSDRVCYGADADVAMRAVDAVDRNLFAPPTTADTYREVADRVDLYAALPSVRAAGVSELAKVIRRWADALVPAVTPAQEP